MAVPKLAALAGGRLPLLCVGAVKLFPHLFLRSDFWRPRSSATSATTGPESILGSQAPSPLATPRPPLTNSYLLWSFPSWRCLLPLALSGRVVATRKVTPPLLYFHTFLFY